jgi:plasmid stability protein
MANLTITIDDETLRLARIRALHQGTSVNALLREYLEAYAVTDRTRQALDGFLELARRSRASSGAAGRRWTRDELHER